MSTTDTENMPAASSLAVKEKDGEKMPVNIVYPTGLRFVLIMLSNFAGIFLVVLDRLIVSTAIPQITNDFRSAGDIGWYGTAYLLPNCAFQLLFGKLYAVFPVKPIFLFSIVLFEAGSALCGAAPNSISFILGRAIAGLGAGGVLAGGMSVMVYCLPLQKRPKYQGFFGAIFAIASIMGPLVGGAFTTNVTWRWCFYLNLPIGGVVLVLIAFMLRIPDEPGKQMDGVSLPNKLRRLDGPGLLALVSGIVCLCLALQWGGTKYAWGSGCIVALLVVASVMLVAFMAIQVLLPAETVTVPPRILLQRSVAAGFLASSCVGAHMTIFAYFLPIWFQAIQGVSAVTSGIRTLPMMIPVVVGSIITGILVSRLGYYTPFLIVGICCFSIASGLLSTLGVSATTGQWAGYQLLYGFGLGFSNQAANMAAQTVLPRKDAPVGVALMFFGQQLFGAVFTSAGQNILDNQLAKGLAARLPSLQLTPQQLQSTGATELLAQIPSADRQVARVVYNDALRVVFRLGLIMACISVLGGLAMEWRSVKKNQVEKEKVAEKGNANDAAEGKN